MVDSPDSSTNNSTNICERCREPLPAAGPEEADTGNRMQLCAPCRDKLLGNSKHRAQSAFRGRGGPAETPSQDGAP